MFERGELRRHDRCIGAHGRPSYPLARRKGQQDSNRESETNQGILFSSKMARLPEMCPGPPCRVPNLPGRKTAPRQGAPRPQTGFGQAPDDNVFAGVLEQTNAGLRRLKSIGQLFARNWIGSSPLSHFQALVRSSRSRKNSFQLSGKAPTVSTCCTAEISSLVYFFAT